MEDVLQQAQAEELTLRVANNATGYLCVCHKPGRAKPYLAQMKSGGKNVYLGYFGVNLANPGHPKPYQAQLSRGGKQVYLGCFATADEAALCVACAVV